MKLKNDEVMQIGCVVDSVNEVLDVSAERIEPAPSFGSLMNIDCLLGLAKLDEGKKVVALLDIDRVLAELDVAGLGSTSFDEL